MAVVNEGIVVVAGGALPGQNNGILIALFAVDKGLVGVDDGTVGHTSGVVGVAGVELAVLISGGSIDFIQTGLGNVHGHMAAILTVGDGELAGILVPGGGLVGTGGIRKEFNGHTGILAVSQALAEGVIEIVSGQGRCLGGDGGQSGNNLIFHGIASGSGSGVGEAIRDGSGTLILAGQRHSLSAGYSPPGLSSP